jgi:hypothetical protein
LISPAPATSILSVGEGCDQLASSAQPSFAGVAYLFHVLPPLEPCLAGGKEPHAAYSFKIKSPSLSIATWAFYFFSESNDGGIKTDAGRIDQGIANWAM